VGKSGKEVNGKGNEPHDNGSTVSLKRVEGETPRAGDGKCDTGLRCHRVEKKVGL